MSKLNDRIEKNGGRRQSDAFTEQELVQEVVKALRSIRYGNVVLTIHDGKVVELQKVERIKRAKEE